MIQIQQLVEEHQFDHPPNDELDAAFRDLASSLTKKYMKPDQSDIEDEAIEECVFVAFEKLKRYNPEKTKAHCYFSTIMMCVLRQHYRMTKSWKTKT